MLRLIRVFLSIVVLLTAQNMMGQASSSKVKIPDFAFPKTVIQQSSNSLSVAMRDGDNEAIIRSLLDYALAENAIGSGSLPDGIKKIDSVMTVCNDPVLTGMLSMLEAYIYNNVYTMDSWRYDRRNSPMEPLPADYNEWSGEQFRHKIESLIDVALSDSTSLRAVPLREYRTVITQDRQTEIYYPTLYDFIACQTVSIFKSWSDNQHFFPLWMARASANSLNKLTLPSLKRDPRGEKILAIYASVLSDTKRGSATDVNTRLERLQFLQSNIVDGNNNPYDRLSQSLYMELYDSYLNADGKPTTEYAGDILLAVPGYGDNNDREMYDVITSFIKACPGYWRKNCLRQKLNQMTQKRVEIHSPQVAAPGKEMEIGVSLFNVENMTVDIYDVSSAPVWRDDYKLGTGRKIASIPVDATGNRVPFRDDRKVRYTFSRPGNYIAVPVVNGITPKNSNFQKIHVTNVALCSSTFLDRTVWAVNASDGAPLGDVIININKSRYGKNRNTERLGATGADGALSVKDVSGVLTAINGADRYALPLYIYNFNYDRPDKWVMASRGYSSLPIYHQGDTVEWVAICYEYKGGLNRPYSGKSVSAVLYDANSVAVDTLKCDTDRFGRACGKFTLPTSGLTGRYRIAIDDQFNTVNFEVSDYKLPTFRVVAPKIERGVPESGDVTIRGNVETYSGFPLADAEVTVALKVAQRPRWWYMSREYDVYSTTVRTDANGSYEVVFTDDIFATSPLENGYYTVSVTALSSTGESQTGSVSFSRGERYLIKVAMPADIDMSETYTLPVDVRLVNYEDSVVMESVNVKLVGSDSTVVASSSIKGKGLLSVKGCDQGVYKVVFTHENADSVVNEVVLYDSDSAGTPYPDALIWSPDEEISVNGTTDSYWLYAVNCDTHVLATLWSSGRVISQRWEKAHKGFNRISVDLPADIDEATLTVMATGDYRQENRNVKVKRTGSMKGLKIVAETFRDRTVPGGEETWTFRVIDLNGNGREAAVIADMYNTALDALSKSDWSFNANKGWQKSFAWNVSSLRGTSDFYYSLPTSQVNLKCPDFVDPDFNTYGVSFRNIRLRGMKMSRALTGSLSGLVLSEPNVIEEQSVESAKDYDYSAPSMAQKKADSGMGDDEVGAVREHSEEVTVSEKESFSYRESDVPLAFFRPSLVTGKDGKLALKFTVPNANTTWGFRAVAFTDSLLSATFSRDILASKEIMVQPNLPRFLRAGDRVVVKASVMNATDEEQRVETVVEIFNPSDGEVMYSFNQSDTIAPNGSKVVETGMLSVPSDMPLWGYRIKSSTETRADGEQVLIPVLPSVTPVIETYPFYVAPEQSEFSMKLPKLPADSRVTLQFCENPVWYVVTALPGLLQKDATSAPDAARSIFSAAVASGLLRDNPEIAAALKEWNESDKSAEMLTSMLERNEKLKIVLLNASPWMLDARNDTERMSRLALLFDKKTVEKTIDANISLLAKLSHKSGGWSWCAQYSEPSRWATNEVLWMMGRLVRLGFLPEDSGLRKMISTALDWDTSETLKEFRKYPEGVYTRYVHLHDMFAKMNIGAADGRIVDSVTQRILNSWKNEPLACKAIDAQVLYNHDYRSVSKELIASMRQFAKTTPENGMWFPSLDDNVWYGSMNNIGITSLILETFAMIEPGCDDIDLLRQWLILQKGAQNWGSSVAATEAVSAILTTSSKWIVPASGSVVRVGGSELRPDRVERLTGEYEMDLRVDKSSGKSLSITKKGDTPSWGAVFCQYVDDMTSVKAQDCPELSVAKELLVAVDQSGDGNFGRQAVKNADSFTIGDRVTVRLLLKADRDMDYVAIVDDRPACFEPVEQLPAPMYSDGIRFYRENRDASTRIFIDHLPKGTYLLSYDMWVNNAGTYISGIATVQSEYAPQYSAHSSGDSIEVK